MSFKDLARMEGYDLDKMESDLAEAISRAARAEDKNEELQKLVASMEKELTMARAYIAEVVAENRRLRQDIAAMREQKRQAANQPHLRKKRWEL